MPSVVCRQWAVVHAGGLMKIDVHAHCIPERFYVGGNDVHITRDGSTEAPHIDVAVFSRGLLNHLVTRIYFPEAPENAADPVLAALDPDRRATLVAEQVNGGYRFDIHLQGDGETVFFDV